MKKKIIFNLLSSEEWEQKKNKVFHDCLQKNAHWESSRGKMVHNCNNFSSSPSPVPTCMNVIMLNSENDFFSTQENFSVSIQLLQVGRQEKKE